MNWQPIDTAPKDGSAVLGWSPDDGTAIIEWINYSHTQRWNVIHDHESYAWNGYAPTHWMPLPAPPP